MPGSSIGINGLGVIYGVAPCPVILPCALAPPVFLPSSLIPVLVTGIQPRRVCALNDLPFLDEEFSAPKDLGALDSCDEHRNEGRMGVGVHNMDPK
jgi:hypothetical protein